MFRAHFAAAGAAAAVSMLVGCASPRPPAGPDNPGCQLRDFVQKDIYSRSGIYLAPARVPGAPAEQPPSLNVLALSAGGEFGAYGAGVLNGWRSVGAAARPMPRDDIQIVTGVSTGAILATHAFLGADAEIEQAYLESSGERTYRVRPTATLLWANSLLDASGKAALIRRYLSSELIERVARASDERGLYIGVVDADSGEFLRIDMVALARTLQPAARRDDCYRAVVGASSAIPVAFQPVFIDGKMFIDGGARRHLFLTEPPPTALQPGTARRLFSFVHGDLRIEPTEVRNHVLDIAGRLSDLVTEQGMRDSVQLADFLAREPVARTGPSTAPREPMFQTHYAAAASAAAQCAPAKQDCRTTSGVLAEDMFCQPFMACLAAQGRRDGEAYARGQTPWPQWNELRAPVTRIDTQAPAPSPLRRPLQ